MADALPPRQGITAADVGDAQEGFGVATGLRPCWTGAFVAGPARTVWTRAGDNLFVSRALDQARSGEVIVVNGHGSLSSALVGGRLGARARSIGVAGFVVDGAVRDVDALQQLGIPVFARGVTPCGPTKVGPGRLDVPIAVGGVVVGPGDLVVADTDGVVFVPLADARGILGASEHIVRGNHLSEAARS